MKKAILFLLIIVFVKCDKKQESKEDNLYEILSVLYNDIIDYHIKDISVPKPKSVPPGSSVSLDSIKKIIENDRKTEKDTVKFINEFVKKNGKLIVAINPTLFTPYTDNLKKEYLKDCIDGYEDIFLSLKETKDSLAINIAKIPLNKYSYILPYQDYYKKTSKKGYDKYDIILNFSNITFNKNFTKAILITGVGFGKLNGFSFISFLEKRKGKWYVKCEKGLTIS
ncbi:MAG: hypothetical protein AB8B78_10000 [Polaribacter sp.]